MFVSGFIVGTIYHNANYVVVFIKINYTAVALVYFGKLPIL